MRYSSTAILFLTILTSGSLSAQSLLSKKVSFTASRQPLANVLETIGQEGNFYFSYDSKILAKDSLVSLLAREEPVGTVLRQLFSDRYEYRQIGSYLIIRLPGRQLALALEDISSDERFYTVSGFVYNEHTGEKIRRASVYEKQLLVSTLTDSRGTFRIRIRNQHRMVTLTASKELFADTSVVIQLAASEVGPGSGPDPSRAGPGEDPDQAEKTFLGRFFTSSRQRIQSLNIGDFFADRPYQISLTPGLSTHGRMSSQVVNKVSLNYIGGYTAGVEGFEGAGVFNINRKSMRYVQVAGLFNVVGRNANGFQGAGLHNMVMNDLQGMQMAGIYNGTEGTVSGLQAAGILNRSGGQTSGVQLAGVGNYSRGHTNGLQLGAIGNISRGTMQGLQLSVGVNYARTLTGVQIGLVNMADSSAGTSIGLLNIIRKNGYYKLGMAANESFHTNLVFKSGTPRLYTILTAGMNGGPRKSWSFGAGLGKEIGLRDRLSVNPEISFLGVLQGDNDHPSHIYRLNTSLHYKLTDRFTLFAGPSFNLYYSEQVNPVEGYAFIPHDRNHFSFAGNLIGWIGWNAGISLF